MEAWERWWFRAVNSLAAASLLRERDQICSAVSRSYYAAYQAATALLLYSKQRPPAGREAWDHKKTPELLRETQMAFLDQNNRYKPSDRLSILYKLRVAADYQTRTAISDVASLLALKDANYIVKSVGDVLPLIR